MALALINSCSQSSYRVRDAHIVNYGIHTHHQQSKFIQGQGSTHIHTWCRGCANRQERQALSPFHQTLFHLQAPENNDATIDASCTMITVL